MKRKSNCLYRTGYDFKRLFTISEYYDRNRVAFYTAIQSVREHNMDMTGWLEYFTEGLATQLMEVRDLGSQAIKTDILIKQYDLNERQAKTLNYLHEHSELTIQDLEIICPDVNRRTLQRDLKGLVESGLINASGATNRQIYRLVN